MHIYIYMCIYIYICVFRLDTGIVRPQMAHQVGVASRLAWRSNRLVCLEDRNVAVAQYHLGDQMTWPTLSSQSSASDDLLRLGEVAGAMRGLHGVYCGGRGCPGDP